MAGSGIGRVAVIGTGTIGASWAAFFLARGLFVAASDPAPQAESAMRRFIAACWPELRRLGAAATPPFDRLSFYDEPEAAAAGADFVQENAPEREAVKCEVLRRLGAVVPASVVIASSSSGLLISRLQADCRHPERCVIGHPFNPPHLVPLVEVVGGEKTAPATIERALAIYAALGKRPIHIRREVKGHVANRLQAALWREAVHLVAEGVASVADIDTAISEGPGLRWALLGPHLIFHLAGGAGGIAHFLDQFAGPIEEWWQDLGRPQLTETVRQKLAAGIAAEAAGRKIDELAAERDRLLVEILALKRGGANT
ncbi:MAG TPA: 3-hydroxyacyl-CoA dehydrogenase NAD-binding domain-containing protein [Stellaceae bacterium]|nr:3-hydroxyacyl-CoA dehydrogenase NAD-binding domain-containing protein [Stellaceae bacterium]